MQLMKRLCLCNAIVTSVLLLVLSVPFWCSAYSDLYNPYSYLTPNSGDTDSQTNPDTKPYMVTKSELKYTKRRKRLQEQWGIDIDRFLEQYGYLEVQPNTASPNQTRIHTNYERKVALGLYQQFHGIKSTGKLNKKTVKLMREPRCGLPDMRLNDPYSNIRSFHFYKYYPRWRRSILTWRALKYTKKVSPLGLWKTLKKAFETWEAVSGLRFLYTRQTPDIQIDFEHGNHGDGSKIAFDEKNGQVAHAFGPGTYMISGAVHLDEDEKWTLNVDPNDGLNLLAVAIHELGHSLGLQHSRDPRSVMFPTFVKTNLDLSVNDIENVQILYGPNPNRETRVQEPEIEKKDKVCKIPMDDIELGPDGYGYIFKGSYLTQIDLRGKVVKTHGKKDKVTIHDIYENGPPRVDAVAFYKEQKKTYMFYNDTLWRYTNFHLDRGYPKKVTGMLERPRAGAFIRDQYGVTRLLLFGSEVFWEWSTSRDQVSKGYPMSTLQYFEGLPRNVHAAVRWKDGYIYFFKSHKVYKLNPGSYKVIAGYPQPLPPYWMTDICPT